MSILHSFDPEISEHADPANVDALADHFEESFQENGDIQKRLKVSRAAQTEQAVRIMLRKSVAGIIKTLIGNAEYDKKMAASYA